MIPFTSSSTTSGSQSVRAAPQQAVFESQSTGVQPIASTTASMCTGDSGSSASGTFVVGALEAVEAGGAGHRDRVELHVVPDLDELVGRQGSRQQAVGGVAGGVATALPAGGPGEIDVGPG